MNRISAVIPSYNRPELLHRLLDSVARQTVPCFETIVVDDFSERGDEVRKTVASFRSSIPRLRLIANSENRGAPFSRNVGIRMATGEFIAFVDDDDEWLATKIQKQSEAINGSSDPRLAIVYSWADAVDETGSVVHRYRSTIEGKAAPEILRECFIPSPSVVVRKSAITAVGLFDERLPSCQDWDTWTKILTKGYTCRAVKSVEAIYHKHGGASIGLSVQAVAGYRKYYKKHVLSALRFLSFAYLYQFARVMLRRI